MLARSVMGPQSGRAPAPTELRRGVAIVNSPLVHIGGVFPGAAMRRRGQIFRAAGTIRTQRVGRGGAQAPATHGFAGTGRIADGVALRFREPTWRASAPSPAAPHHLSADDADAFTQKYRHSRPDILCRNRIRWRCRRVDAGDYQQYWRAKRGSVGRANPGAQLRVVDDGRHTARAGSGWPAGSQARTAGAVGEMDADHGYGPHRRRRICLGRRSRRSGDHPWRIQGDARRRAGRAWRATPRWPARRWSGDRDERLGETPVAMVELRESALTDPASWSSICERGWPATRFPLRSR